MSGPKDSETPTRPAEPPRLCDLFRQRLQRLAGQSPGAAAAVMEHGVGADLPPHLASRPKQAG